MTFKEMQRIYMIYRCFNRSIRQQMRNLVYDSVYHISECRANEPRLYLELANDPAGLAASTKDIAERGWFFGSRN